MFRSQLTLTHLMVLLFAVFTITAAPTKTEKYPYKVAKRADIVGRGTRTRALQLQRRASPLPGQVLYAVFENTYFGGSYTFTATDSSGKTFDGCAKSCTATNDCLSFRWGQTGTGECALRTGSTSLVNRYADVTYRGALKGRTCAQAKAQFTDLAPRTCVEEYH